MSSDFYSNSNQTIRELRALARCFEWRDITLGVGLAFVSFYLFRYPGHSQVYQVVLPYVLIALYLELLIIMHGKIELDDTSAGFYAMLPRDAKPSFDAKLLGFALYASVFEVAILIGAALKLGGAGITPVYRLHPEIMVLPYVGVLLGLCYAHHPPNQERGIFAFFSFFLLGLPAGARWALTPEANALNGWLPPREMSLTIQLGIAVFLLALTGWMAFRIRREYRNLRASA